MGAQACLAHCLRTWIRPECSLSSPVRWDTGFALQSGEAMAVPSVLVPLQAGLLGGLCSFPCPLNRFWAWTGWRLHSVLSKATNSLPRCSERSCSKASKAFWCLTWGWPALKLSLLPANLSAGVLLGHTALSYCWQSFWSDGAEDTLHRGWHFVSAPLPGWERERQFQATLKFSNRLPGWKRPGAARSLGYE